jgi:hypothetical protein
MIPAYIAGVLMVVLLLGLILLPGRDPELGGNTSSPPAVATLRTR